MKKRKVYLDVVGKDGYMFTGDDGEDIAKVWKDTMCQTDYCWKVKLNPGLHDKSLRVEASFKRITEVKNYLVSVGSVMNRYDW